MTGAAVVLESIVDAVRTAIVGPLVYLWPIKWSVVRQGEGGLRFRKGKVSQVMRTGMWFGTTFDEFEKVELWRHVVDSEGVDVITSDNIPLFLDMVTTYNITNVEHFLTLVSRPDVYICSQTEAAAREETQGLTYSTIVDDLTVIGEHVKSSLQETVAPIGVVVEAVRVQRCRVANPVIQARMVLQEDLPDIVFTTNLDLEDVSSSEKEESVGGEDASD